MLVSKCAVAYQKEYLKKNRINAHNLIWKAIEERCGNKINAICIFGAGFRGKKLYYALMKYMIDVECFSDNSPDKWGVFIENMLCVPPCYLEMDKEDLLVIVAIKGDIKMISHLKEMGMKNVLAEQDIYDIIENFPEVMPVGCIDNIDFTSEECSYLVGKFNLLLRETCRYYEREIDKMKSRIGGQV